MQWTAVFLLVAAAVAVVRGQDAECAPPKPGEKHAHPDECCKFDIMPESFKSKAQTCMEKYPKGPRPTGPPSSTPDPKMKNHHACMAECLFTENNLLTADKKLDKDAVTKLLMSAAAADFKPVVTAALTKCLGQIQVDSEVECQSGAAELTHCMGREVFSNCPSSAWTSSSECDALKTKLAKCPMIPVMVGHGPRKGGRP